jgi:hypothetical protein
MSLLLMVVGLIAVAGVIVWFDDNEIHKGKPHDDVIHGH